MSNPLVDAQVSKIAICRLNADTLVVTVVQATGSEVAGGHT